MTNVGTFITLVSEGSNVGSAAEWCFWLKTRAPGLAQSLTYWLGQDDSEDPDAQVFELFGTLLEVSPKFMKEIEASQALRSAWGSACTNLSPPSTGQRPSRTLRGLT
jgi:hypothetical protein